MKMVIGPLKVLLVLLVSFTEMMFAMVNIIILNDKYFIWIIILNFDFKGII